MTKKRVWGVIQDKLMPGNYELLVDNNYQIVDMRIVKGVLFTTATAMGGKQYFHSICFALACLICIAFAILIKLKLLNKQNISIPPNQQLNNSQ